MLYYNICRGGVMIHRALFSGSCFLCLLGLCVQADAQTPLPRIDIVRPTPGQRPARVARKPALRPLSAAARRVIVRAPRPQPVRRAAAVPAPAPAPAAPAPTPEQAAAAQASRMDA